MIKRLEDPTSKEIMRVMRHPMLMRPIGADQPEEPEVGVEEVTIMVSSEDVVSIEEEVPQEVNLEAIPGQEAEELHIEVLEVDTATLEMNHNINLRMRRSVMDQSHLPQMKSLLSMRELPRTKTSLLESSR